MQVAFSDFVFDAEARLLTRGGQPVHLSPKAFQLLAELIERRPAAVSKQELIDRLWPDVVVEETNLKVLIAEIRSALGDSGQVPKYIRTVHRFGYAFSAEAREQSRPDRLVAARLLHGERAYPLWEGDNMLGRAPDCTVVLDWPGVSRHHALIRVSTGRISVEDLGSKNGTWLNDQRIYEPSDLGDGDRIRLGVVTLVLQSNPGARPTTTMGPM